MKVLQRVGRLAGYVVDMPYAEATACLATGTAKPVSQEAEVGSRPDAAPKPRAVVVPAVPSDPLVNVRKVLAMASDPAIKFLALKSAAAAILGPDLPAKKADIIAALESRLV